MALRDRCKNNQVLYGDNFVGVRSNDDKIEVLFPTGFTIGQTDLEVRSDVLLLLRILENLGPSVETKLQDSGRSHSETTSFPLSSYLELIDIYLSNPRLLIPNEIKFEYAIAGKIDWKRTTQTIPRFINSTGSVIYDRFVVRKDRPTQNHLISDIHQFCLWQGLELVGWIFTSAKVPKPGLPFNKNRFKECIEQFQQVTFNTSERRILACLLAIIMSIEEGNNEQIQSFGTYSFEYYWENLVDKVFGTPNTKIFNPRVSWNISDKKFTPPPLRLDSIMLCNQGTFILDAKYYKFGVTADPQHLPGTSDISKQIVYGKNVKRLRPENDTYNAFILPGNTVESDSKPILEVGSATAEWINNPESFEIIKAVVVDTKSLFHWFDQRSTIPRKLLADTLATSDT